ncbi:MAG: hypothetical protein WBF33_15355 [Candidatus Nitrosopolaris sp.]|jgi:hypothetical protein
MQDVLKIVSVTASFFGVGGLILYVLKRRNIPKLKYDGFWKKKNEDGIPSEFYFVKVSREGGEGKAEGVTGLVGIVDKLDLKEAGWLSSNMRSVDIITNKYLLLFRILKNKEKTVITFHGIDYDPNKPHFKHIFQTHIRK